MKKYTSLFIAGLLGASASYGQTLVAGWDFNTTGNVLAVDKSQITAESGLSASDGQVILAGGIENYGPGFLWAESGSGLNSGLNITTGAANDDFQTGSGLILTRNTGAPNSDLTSITFAVTPTSFSQAPVGTVGFDSWFVTYGSLATQGVDLLWEFSTDNSSWNSITAGNQSVGTSDAPTTFSFADTVVSDTMYLRASVSAFDNGEQLTLDNVAIYGSSVVPEPSTYAAIFGAVALAFAAARRRK